MNRQQGPANIVRLFGEFLMVPITAFVYGAEMLLNALRGAQQAANQGMDMVAGPPAQSGAWPEIRAAPAPAASSVIPAAQGPVSGVDSNDATSGNSEIKNKEEQPLSTDGNSATGLDKDLHDDMLKLVRYKVLFVRREYEVAFPEKEDLVSDNMDGSAFTAWKIAEFIQDVEKGLVAVPQKWRDKKYPTDHDGDHLTTIPHEDKKYLRVYYEVLERYPREKFKYEEQQIKVLEDIRDELKRPSSASGEPAAAGGAKKK